MFPQLWVRHAQPEFHVDGKTGGWTDSPLTDLGRRQAELLAERLAVELEGIAWTLYASDLQRAWQTAEIIAADTGVQPIAAPALREINNGVAADKSIDEARKLALPRTEPWLDWQPYPEAETWRRFHQRVAGFLEEVTPTLDGPAVWVSHGGTINNAILWWMELGAEGLNNLYFDCRVASITVLRVNRWGDRTVERQNDTAHLYAAGLAEPIVLAPRE